MDVECALECLDCVKPVDFEQLKSLSLLHVHFVDTESDGVACIGGFICFACVAVREDFFLVVVEDVECKAVFDDCKPRLADFFLGKVLPWNFELVQFHSPFLVKNPLKDIRGNGVVLQMHLIDGVTDNLAALDKFNFCFSGAGVGKQASQTAHHCANHSAVVLVFYLH